jgi:hypothetical protein
MRMTTRKRKSGTPAMTVRERFREYAEKAGRMSQQMAPVPERDPVGKERK